MNIFLSISSFFIFTIFLSIIQFTSSSSITRGLPSIIGHRGASGHRPENTLASWDTAIQFGADFIEIDLATTKDHVLVASHNPDITHTTDVADHPEFLSRYVTKNISGEIYEGYFVDDFTVSELKSLRTRERYPFRNQTWNDLYPMATLQEYLTFVRAKEIELGKKIGIYMETKHPSYYRSVGLPLEEILIQKLQDFGYSNKDDLAYIESFESNLKYIRTLTDLPLVQLMSGTEGDKVQFDTRRSWKQFATAEGLREVAKYAQVIAPHKSVIFESSVNRPTSFIRDAHSAGLQVHVWTFRKEAQHFEKNEKHVFSSVQEEIRAFFNQGVDAIFTDQPDIGVQVKSEMYPQSHQSNSSSVEDSYSVSMIFSVLAVFGLFHLSKNLRSNDKSLQETKLFLAKRDQSNAF